MNFNLSFFLGIARIAATIGIFMFHFLALTGGDRHNIDFYAILTFCFLTGYLSFGAHKEPLKWLYRRLSSILVPYWFVIIPVVILNRIVHYKETTLTMDVITVLGGNLFLNNPIYIIAWYITFVNIMYIFLFLQSATTNNILRLVFWAAGWIFFGVYLHKPYYFIAFSIGYFGAILFPLPQMKIKEMKPGNRIIFSVQDKCYAFFLIHGGVLIFLSVVLKLTGLSLLLWGVFLSAIGSVLLRHMSKPLTKKVIDLALSLSPRGLRSVEVKGL